MRGSHRSHQSCLLVLLVGASLLLGARAWGLTPSEIYSTAIRSVVAVEAVKADGAVQRGTGFFIASDVVATNFHVVRGGRSLRVVPLTGGSAITATRMAADEAEADIALLRVAGAGLSPLPLADSSVASTGARIYVLGNPRGLDGTFSEGLVSAVRRLGGTTTLQLSTPISPGSSGSPVMDSSGRVVGIVRSMLRSGTNLVFATPVSYLSDLLILSRAAAPGQFEGYQVTRRHPAAPVRPEPSAPASLPREGGDGSPAATGQRVIIFGVPHWASAAATGHILKALIETRTPHHVQLRRGTNAEVFRGMDDPQGTFDVHPEIWLPNHSELWDRYVENRRTVIPGSFPYSGFQGLCTQGFVHERYGLSRVEELRKSEIARLFDRNGDGKGELWLGAPDWHSTAIYRVKVRDYDLDPLYRAWVSPEDKMWWRLPDLFQRKIPTLFFCYAPHWTVNEFDLWVLDEPANAPGCYAMKNPTFDHQWFEKSVARCKEPSPRLHLGFAARLRRDAPAVAALLQQVRLDATIVSEWTNNIRRDEVDPYLFARTWVRSHGSAILSAAQSPDAGFVPAGAGRHGFGLDLPAAPQ